MAVRIRGAASGRCPPIHLPPPDQGRGSTDRRWLELDERERKTNDPRASPRTPTAGRHETRLLRACAPVLGSGSWSAMPARPPFHSRAPPGRRVARARRVARRHCPSRSHARMSGSARGRWCIVDWLPRHRPATVSMPRCRPAIPSADAPSFSVYDNGTAESSAGTSRPTPTRAREFPDSGNVAVGSPSRTGMVKRFGVELVLTRQIDPDLAKAVGDNGPDFPATGTKGTRVGPPPSVVWGVFPRILRTRPL